MDKNCHIPDLVQAFSNVENGGLNLFLQLAKPLTCMTVASNSIILSPMREQNRQTQQVKMSKIGVEQSTLCYNLNLYKNKQIYQQRTTEKHIDKAHIKQKRMTRIQKFTIAQ